MGEAPDAKELKLKGGTPWYDGDDKWADEFKEAAEGFFYGLKLDERRHCATRIKSHLFGNAKLMTKSKKTVSYAALEKTAAAGKAQRETSSVSNTTDSGTATGGSGASSRAGGGAAGTEDGEQE